MKVSGVSARGSPRKAVSALEMIELRPKNPTVYRLHSIFFPKMLLTWLPFHLLFKLRKLRLWVVGTHFFEVRHGLGHINSCELQKATDSAPFLGPPWP